MNMNLVQHEEWMDLLRRSTEAQERQAAALERMADFQQARFDAETAAYHASQDRFVQQQRSLFGEAADASASQR